MLDNSRRCKIGTGVGVKGFFFAVGGGTRCGQKITEIPENVFFVRVKIGGKRFGNNELSGGC